MSMDSIQKVLDPWLSADIDSRGLKDHPGVVRRSMNVLAEVWQVGIGVFSAAVKSEHNQLHIPLLA